AALLGVLACCLPQHAGDGLHVGAEGAGQFVGGDWLVDHHEHGFQVAAEHGQVDLGCGAAHGALPSSWSLVCPLSSATDTSPSLLPVQVIRGSPSGSGASKLT